MHLIDYVEGTYKGTIVGEKDKKPHGTFTFRNGNVYTGEVRKVPVPDSNFFLIKPHGIGKMVSASGETYEGEFKNGLRSGLGVYTKNNGKIYQGQFVDNQILRCT